MCTHNIEWYIIASKLHSEDWSAFGRSRVVSLTVKNKIWLTEILDVIHDVPVQNIWSLWKRWKDFACAKINLMHHIWHVAVFSIDRPMSLNFVRIEARQKLWNSRQMRLNNHLSKDEGQTSVNNRATLYGCCRWAWAKSVGRCLKLGLYYWQKAWRE